MKIYKCENCGKFFSEDELNYTIHRDMEDYYGVGNEFHQHHYEDIVVCPECRRDELEELTAEEVLEELGLTTREILEELNK